MVQQEESDGGSKLESPIYIAIMGITGAGKSSLISLLCEDKPEIWHDLSGCTRQVGTYKCKNLVPGKSIFLIDTPGFDDGSVSDTEVLRELAVWLAQTYSNNTRLNGIIYLHRISDVRMQGSQDRNILMFKNLCGDGAFKNVILVTTMWDRVSADVGADREKQLIETPEFWGWMTSKGSRVFRHHNTLESAKSLLHGLLPSVGSKVVLDIQQQMVDDHKPLNETTAGIALNAALAEERARFEKELASIREEMKKALAARDRETQEALEEVRAQYQELLQRLEKNQESLKVSFKPTPNAPNTLSSQADEQVDLEHRKYRNRMPN